MSFDIAAGVDVSEEQLRSVVLPLILAAVDTSEVCKHPGGPQIDCGPFDNQRYLNVHVERYGECPVQVLPAKPPEAPNVAVQVTVNCYILGDKQVRRMLSSINAAQRFSVSAHINACFIRSFKNTR